MKTIKPTTRRNFLLAAGLGGAGAVAAVATARKQNTGATPAETTVAKGDGYRASPHIMKYYKTTEV
jgi:hypothetical protein